MQPIMFCGPQAPRSQLWMVMPPTVIDAGIEEGGIRVDRSRIQRGGHGQHLEDRTRLVGLARRRG